MVTPVAAKPLLRTSSAVNGEWNITVGTHHHLSAAATAQEGAVSAPRHQHDGLLPFLWKLCQTVHQGSTDQALIALGQFMPHIDDPYRWQWLAGNPRAQPCKNQRSVRLKTTPTLE